jgi:hypothetical protein
MDVESLAALLRTIVTATDGRSDIGVCMVCCSGLREHEPNCAYNVARELLDVTEHLTQDAW